MTGMFRFAEPVGETGGVVVAETGGDGYTQYLVDGRHHLFADESVASGGGDAGPEPYELLLMSLGACTSITLRMYARRHQWPLERVVVRLKHSRQHADDCANCERETRLLSRIQRDVELHGPLSGEQKTRLMGIANRCPVHQTLSIGIAIETSFVDPQ